MLRNLLLVGLGGFSRGVGLCSRLFRWHLCCRRSVEHEVVRGTIDVVEGTKRMCWGISVLEGTVAPSCCVPVEETGEVVFPSPNMRVVRFFGGNLGGEGAAGCTVKRSNSVSTNGVERADKEGNGETVLS